MDALKVGNPREEGLCSLHGSDKKFERILKRSHLPAGPALKFTNPRMTLPRDFVEQHWDRNIPGSVELRNEATRRIWTVQLGVNHREKVTKQVMFYGRGWSGFATSHGLVEGDLVTFELTANSIFYVDIFQKGVKMTVPPVEHPPKEWLETTETTTDESCGNEFGHVTKSARIATSSPGLVRTGECDELASPSASKAPQILSQSKAGNEAPNFTRQGTGPDNPPLKRQHCQNSDISTASELIDHQKLRTTLEKRGVERIGNLNAPGQKKSLLFPSFLKLLTFDNYLHCLEIPGHFSSTWGSDLHSYVKLQGIHKGSAERIVACNWTSNKDKLFLTDGWKEFQEENNLEAGIALGFTLTANSFFVVRGFHL